MIKNNTTQKNEQLIKDIKNMVNQVAMSGNELRPGESPGWS